MGKLERPLRGFEKFCALPNNRTTIAHSYSLRGDIQYIIDSALDAIVYLHERHPILRAVLVFPEGSEEIYVQCRETPMSKEQLASTFKVISECQPSYWQEHISNICNQFMDPTRSQSPSSFEFHLLRTKGEPEHAYFIIFSDHCFSDGFSGFRLVYDFLSFIFEKKKFPNMPLPPSAVDLMTSHPKLLTGCLKMLKPLFQKKVVGVCTVFPIPDYIPEPGNKLIQYPKYFSFRSIRQEKYFQIIEICKAKGVTLIGPLLVTMAAALSRVGPKPSDAHPSFSRLIDVDINVRTRCKPPLGDDSIANLVSLASSGSFISRKLNVSLNSNFWKLALGLKRKVHTIANIGLTCVAMPVYFDIIASSEPTLVNSMSKAKKLLFGDINLSNLGRFPFPATYIRSTSDKCKVVIESVRFCSNMPAVGNAASLFVCAQHSLTLTMCHRTDVEVAEKFFSEWIRLVEGIPSIQKNETIGQFLSRVLD